MKRYTFLITEELDAALKALKARDDVDASKAIRRSLSEFLERKRIAVGTKKAERKRVAPRKRP